MVLRGARRHGTYPLVFAPVPASLSVQDQALHPAQWATKHLPVLRQTRTQQGRCAAGPEGGDVRGGRALAQEDLRRRHRKDSPDHALVHGGDSLRPGRAWERAICRNTSARHAGEGTSRSARVSSRSSARAAWYAARHLSQASMCAAISGGILPRPRPAARASLSYRRSRKASQFKGPSTPCAAPDVHDGAES